MGMNMQRNTQERGRLLQPLSLSSCYVWLSSSWILLVHHHRKLRTKARDGGRPRQLSEAEVCECLGVSSVGGNL